MTWPSEVENRRRALMATDRELYDHIRNLITAQTLNSAGDTASGAQTGHGAANRLWREADRLRALWGNPE